MAAQTPGWVASPEEGGGGGAGEGGCTEQLPIASGAAAQDVGEVVAHGLFELRIVAAPGSPVRAPAPELGGVPEPRALHVLVRDLTHQLGPERHPRQVLLGVPPAQAARQAVGLVSLGV